MKEWMGHVGAMLVVAVWGTTFVSSKLLIGYGLTPADIFFYRFLLAYVCMVAVSHRRMWSGSVRDELSLMGLGIMGGSLYFLTENMALVYSTSANVSILVSTTPIVTALVVSVFYKSERMTRRQALGSLCAFVGVVLVVLNGQLYLHLNLRGDLLALCASCTWACYSLLMRRVMLRYGAVFLTRKVFGYGVLTILPWFLLVHPLCTDTAILMHTPVLSNLLFLGLCIFPKPAHHGGGLRGATRARHLDGATGLHGAHRRNACGTELREEGQGGTSHHLTPAPQSTYRQETLHSLQ